MGASYSLSMRMINQNLRGITQPTNTAVYLALYVTDPTGADTGTEVTGAGYARQRVTFGEPQVVGDAVQSANSNKIDFGVAGSNWGNVAYGALRTAATGGELIAFGAMAVAKDIGVNDQPIFNIGSLVAKSK